MEPDSEEDTDTAAAATDTADGVAKVGANSEANFNAESNTIEGSEVILVATLVAIILHNGVGEPVWSEER